MPRHGMARPAAGGGLTVLDVRLLRRRPEDVARQLKKKRYDLDVKRFLALEVERKAAQAETERLQH